MKTVIGVSAEAGAPQVAIVMQVTGNGHGRQVKVLEVATSGLADADFTARNIQSNLERHPGAILTGYGELWGDILLRLEANGLELQPRTTHEVSLSPVLEEACKAASTAMSSNRVDLKRFRAMCIAPSKSEVEQLNGTGDDSGSARVCRILRHVAAHGLPSAATSPASTASRQHPEVAFLALAQAFIAPDLA